MTGQSLSGSMYSAGRLRSGPRAAYTSSKVSAGQRRGGGLSRDAEQMHEEQAGKQSRRDQAGGNRQAGRGTQQRSRSSAGSCSSEGAKAGRLGRRTALAIISATITGSTARAAASRPAAAARGMLARALSEARCTTQRHARHAFLGVEYRGPEAHRGSPSGSELLSGGGPNGQR